MLTVVVPEKLVWVIKLFSRYESADGIFPALPNVTRIADSIMYLKQKRKHTLRVRWLMAREWLVNREQTCFSQILMLLC